MDDIVRQALAKWPRVPHCHGWLGLDARGQWWMRDDRTQALGPFPQSRGSLLRHDKLIDFIHRNYDCDSDGCWYFQNGPQRVYVELEDTPVIWRLDTGLGLRAHTGTPARMDEPPTVLTDEQGRVYLVARLLGDDPPAGGAPVVGLVHTQDVALVADAIEQRGWALRSVRHDELPQHHAWRRSPAEAAQAVAAAAATAAASRA